MLTVIFDLVDKVMANVDLFDEQMSLINMVNHYIVTVDVIDNEHLQKIIKINTILHHGNKDRYENGVESDFITFLINMITSKSRSQDMLNLMASFITSLNKLKFKPFDIKDLQAEFMINGTVFDVKTRLNLIKNFSKMSTNLIVYLRNHLLEFLMNSLTSQENLVRSRSLDVLKLLLDTATKKTDVRASLREISLRVPDVHVYEYCIKYLESITSVSRPANTSPELDSEITRLLDMITMERGLKDFQDIFIEIQNVEAYIKGLSEKSLSKDIRKIFTEIYKQMYKNWSNDQRPENLDEDKSKQDASGAKKETTNSGEHEGTEEEDDNEDDN